MTLHDRVGEPIIVVPDEGDDLSETDALARLTEVRDLAVMAICHDPDDWLTRADATVRQRFRAGPQLGLNRYRVDKLAAGLDTCSDESGRNDHDAVGNPVVTDGGTADYESVDLTPGQTPTADVVDAELTKFQVRILAVLAEEARYGLAIKSELEEYYGKAVNHGRLYPNLDTLVNKDFVEKSELDKRTNEYAITDRGAQVLAEEIHWLADHFGVSVSDETDADEEAQ